MSRDIFRIATEEDAPAFLELLSSAFKPLGEMGIDWPSTNATLEMVTENIKQSVAVVLERDGGSYQPSPYVFHGRALNRFQAIHLFGGLPQLLI